MNIPLRLIAELGSCHMGSLARIKEAIDRCQTAGIDDLKVQLFPADGKFTAGGNVWLDPEIFMEALAYAQTKNFSFSASVFDAGSFELLSSTAVKFIKFAYSQKDKYKWFKNRPAGKELIVSCDVMSDHDMPTWATKLYCIPEYPVRYEICFDELFPRFDGFSDHTMGTRQTKRAIAAGAKVIEKHVKLGYADEVCPDARFAVSIEELGRVRL